MADLFFNAGSFIALLAWVSFALSFLPTRFSSLMLRFGGRVVPILLSLMYLILVVHYWGDAPQGDYSSLSGVALLFESHGNLASGWLHFLAFDLLVGRWMIDKTLADKKAKWPLVMCLPLTFWYGPIGLLLFAALSFRSNLTAVIENSASKAKS